MVWFLLILSLVNLVLVVWVLYRLRIFPKRPTTSLLDQLSQQKQQLDGIFNQMTDIKTDLTRLTKDINLSPLVWSLVRFSAFNQIGVHQSFSLCWLNKQKSGYIFTNIYGQNSSRFYLKEVIKGKETVPLSPEEKETLSKALNKLKLLDR